MRKLLTLSLALLLLQAITNAQLTSKTLAKSEYEESLCKVVENFQNNFIRIQGDALPADEDRDIFLSTVHLPGSSKCVIYRFHSIEDTTASWQALLYSGEDYKEATAAYKNAFKHVKQMKVKYNATHISFDGIINIPTESIRFTSSILRPSINTGIYKNFIAEVEMLNSIEGWVVHLNMHSRKADTERYQ